MAYLLLLCTVLLICVQDVVAQTDHKGKEFYFAVMSVQRRYGCLYVSCDRPTKGVVYLYRTNTLTDTIHFSLTPPQRTIPIKIDAERVELQGGALGDATYFKDNLIPRKRSVYVRADHDIELSYLNDTYQDSDRTLLYPLHSYGKDYTINAVIS